ncbi:Uncharacterised protein [Salmonella enterica subsp. enterica serovar Typhi]|nr:Uncharacterised protein [Salmonella enterica subsp. enterica serovar Typhi]
MKFACRETALSNAIHFLLERRKFGILINQRGNLCFFISKCHARFACIFNSFFELLVKVGDLLTQFLSLAFSFVIAFLKVKRIKFHDLFILRF